MYIYNYYTFGWESYIRQFYFLQCKIKKKKPLKNLFFFFFVKKTQTLLKINWAENKYLLISKYDDLWFMLKTHMIYFEN